MSPVSTTRRASPRPFLKYAGGKRSLLPKLFEIVPPTFRTYYEPFVGGGALLFALFERNFFGHMGRAAVADANLELVRAYRALKVDVEGVVAKLRRMKNDEDVFRRVRAKDPAKLDDVAAAARTIYLNKTCFNGLMRLNRRGEFNVPYGRYPNPPICDEENLRAVASALQSVALVHGDFAEITRKVKAGDLVYFDPPYLPVKGKEFVAYGHEPFRLDEHMRLRDEALRLKTLGATVIISNSDAPAIRALYDAADFRIIEVDGRRSISASGALRGSALDLLIT